jgi:hypothetical protein
MLENDMSPLLALHLTGGSLAMASGLVALYAAKGAALHRKSGTIFAYAMLSMSLTGAAVMAAGGIALPAGLADRRMIRAGRFGSFRFVWFHSWWSSR